MVVVRRIPTAVSISAVPFERAPIRPSMKFVSPIKLATKVIAGGRTVLDLDLDKSSVGGNQIDAISYLTYCPIGDIIVSVSC